MVVDLARKKTCVNFCRRRLEMFCLSHPLSDISLYKLSTQIRAGECEFLIGFKKGKKVAPTTLKATITNA
jgi:hypothetical protein